MGVGVGKPSLPTYRGWVLLEGYPEAAADGASLSVEAAQLEPVKVENGDTLMRFQFVK